MKLRFSVGSQIPAHMRDAGFVAFVLDSHHPDGNNLSVSWHTSLNDADRTAAALNYRDLQTPPDRVPADMVREHSAPLVRQATSGPRRAVSGPDKGLPWSHPGCGFVLGPDNETVVGRFPRYADAVLDAAAPDLLNAAIAAMAGRSCSHDEIAISKGTWGGLRDAIAKARGED